MGLQICLLEALARPAGQYRRGIGGQPEERRDLAR